MEADLPLIEISGEDDSLLSLQHSPIVSNDTPYFACSPLLQIPRSTSSLHPSTRAFSSKIIKDEKDTYNHNMDKENVNANKSEALKLSVEPQQMKKKKKGGGYNLRKSLAWDRAFFTDEGVLDPLELSMLSGNALSVIHEGRESLSSELDAPSASPGLRALKHNFFKESPSSARNEGSKLAGKMSKLMSSAKVKLHLASPAKHKVLSAHDINRSSSKRSGCPQSLASSSLKRTSITNVTAKEPRVSKQLDTKNEPLVVSKISRSSIAGASHTKRNVASQPATGQKNIGIKGISSSAKSCANDAKFGFSGKLTRKSTAQPARSMLKVAAEQKMHSSTNLQIHKVSLENNSSQELPHAVVPAAAGPANGHDSTSRKHAASLRQTTCYYGENKQHAQTQIAKPSGLRMPSPSLGYFGQSKSSNSHGELQKGPQSCNFLEDFIPTVSKASVLNSIQKPPRPSKKIPTCSGAVRSLTSTVNDASCGIIKSESELRDNQAMPLLLQVNSESSDAVSSQKQLPDADLKSADDGDPCEKVEKLSCIENIGLQINDIKLPPQSGPCEQLEKHDGKSAVDVCLDLPHSLSPIPLFVEVEGPFVTNNTFVKQQIEDRKCKQSMNSCSVNPESHMASMNNDPDQISSEAHGEQLTGLDEFELSPQQAELKKPGTCRVDSISEMLSQGLNETLTEGCRSSEKGVRDYISNAEDNVLEVQDYGTVSYCPTHSTEAECTKDETSGTDCLNGGLHVGEAQMLSVESTLLVSSCMSSFYTTAADLNWMILDSPSAESAKQREILNSCSVTEQVSRKNCESPSKGFLQYGKCSEAGPSETNYALAKQVEEKKCKQSVKSCSVSPQSHTESMKNNWDNTGSKVDGEQLNGLDEFEPSLQQAELKKPVTCRIDPISDMQSQRCSGTLMRDCTSAEKGNKDDISNAADYDMEVQDRHAVSYCPTHSTEAEPTKNETNETDCLNGGSHVVEMQMLPAEATLLVVSCESSTNPAEDSNLIICDSPTARPAEQTEVLNSSIVTEQISQNNCETPAKGCLQYRKCSEEYEEKNIPQSISCAESRAAGNFCSLASVNPDCNFAASGKMEYRHVENAFTASVGNEPLVGNFSNNVEPCGEANALELDTIYKSDIIGEIITYTALAEKYCLNSGGDIGSKHESSDVVSKIICRRVDVASGMNNPSEEDFFSELQPEASYSPEKETVVLYSDCSTDIHDMREHDEEQAKLISSCSNEVEQVNQNCQLCDDTIGDKNGDVSCIHGCGSEISDSPRKMEEVVGTDNMEKETLNGDALRQFIDESFLADSSNCNIDNSTETKRSLLVVNDKSRQDSELQNLDLVIEQFPLDNAGLCLDDNLLLINTSIESQGKDTVKNVPSELQSFDVDVNADKEVVYQSTRPSCDDIECYKDFDDSNYHKLYNQSYPFNLGSSSNSNSYQISPVANYEFKSGSLNEKTNGTSSGSIHQKAHEPHNAILPSEAEINIHQTSGSFNSGQIDGLCRDLYPEGVTYATLSLNKSVEDKKQDTPAIEPPPNAVPCSDEGLAALGAAGEESLARKGGAVQNSPTYKSSPDCLNGGLHVGEVQMLCVEAALRVVSCKSLTNTAADSNLITFDSPRARYAEQTEVLNSCFVTEQVSQSNCEPPSKGCLQHGKCSEEPQEKNILQSVNSAESRASDIFCSLASINQDCNFAASEKMNVENAFTASVDNEPLVGNSRHHVELYGEANALKLDTIRRSEIIGEIITNNVVEEKYCLNNGGDTGSKHETSGIVSKISCRRVDIASEMNNPSEENFFSELQPEASYSPEKDTVVLHSDCSTDSSTDMHDMREHDEEQAKLISSCSNEVEEAIQDCELRDDTLGDKNGSPEDIRCIHGYEFEISHIPRKMNEVADNMAKKILNEDALVQFIDQSCLANCNIGNSTETKRSPLAVDDESRKDPKLVIEQVPSENAGLCLDDTSLLINTSIDSKGKETFKNIPSGSESFVVDVNNNTDREVEHQPTRPSADNIECYKDCDEINYHEFDSQSCPFNMGSTSNSDGYQISSVANYGSKCSSLNERMNGTSSGSSHQNGHEPYNTILPSEDEININQSSDSFDSELIDQLCSDVATLSLNKSVEDKKQDTPAIKPPPNAVPFSDEWLAALEAAGEEILARKGGAVQNSPTDKSSPTPNPWSPVKRKNNQGLGPFDCTKFINPTDSSSTSN